MERPAGIVDFTPATEHYPFESRWFESSVGPLHHLDEGTGQPLLLLHGNPDWSFLYRKIVLGLRGDFRCVVPDYPGFGLSVHPPGYGYTPAEHAVVVGELVDHLGLDRMLVMGQDWGGPIGMEVASRRPGRVAGLIMGNTWFWPADSRLLRSFSAVMSSPPVQALITRKNAFVDPLMKRSLQVRLSDAEFEHYRAVVPTPASRTGIAVFPRQIRAAGAWLGRPRGPGAGHPARQADAAGLRHEGPRLRARGRHREVAADVPRRDPGQDGEGRPLHPGGRPRPDRHGDP